MTQRLAMATEWSAGEHRESQGVPNTGGSASLGADW